MSKSLRVVFMGTPEFAVASLDEIMKSHHEVVAVVTQPDKPAGRGQKIAESAVKKYAVEHNLPLYQPIKMKDEDFVAKLQEINPDVIVVVAFRILPEVVWSIPSKGTFNLHASLLPQYRGAAPINFAIMNGDTESGLTTFLIDHNIDTGEILLQEKVVIAPEDTAGDLHNNLMEVGKKLVVTTIDGLAEGKLKPHKQVVEGEIKGAPKIFKEDCIIDWSQNIVSLHNKIRGLSPFPTAFTTLHLGEEKKILKLFKGTIEEVVHTDAIGTVIIEGKKKMKIAGNGGYYLPTELQLEGKKRMSVADLINGLSIKEGLKVGE